MSFSITETFEGPIKKHIDTGLLQTGTEEGTKFCINDNIYMSRDGALIDMKNKKKLHKFQSHISRFNYYNNIEKHWSSHWIDYKLSYIISGSGLLESYTNSEIVIQNKSNIYVFDNFCWGNKIYFPYYKLQLNENNELEIIKLDIELNISLDKDTIVIINNDYNIIIINNKLSTALYSLETSEKIANFINYFPEKYSNFDKVPYQLLLLKNRKENKGILYNLATQKIELESDYCIRLSNKYGKHTQDNFYDCIKTSNKTYMFSIDNQPPKKTDAQEAKELRENIQLIINENTKLKKQNKKLQTQLDSITQEKTEIQADLQNAEQEIEEYTTELNEAKEAKKSLEWMRDDYFNQSNQINQLKLTIDTLQKEKKEHTTKKTELLQTIDEQSQNIRKHEVLNTELLKTIDEHEESFNLLEKEKECIDLLKSEYFDELTQSRNTIIDLQKEIDSLQKELNKKWF